MSNHIKFCSCKMCKSNRHSTHGKMLIRKGIRAHRRQVKALLRKGETEIPSIISIPYTD